MAEHTFTTDDWETPDSVARLMASLVQDSDCHILEPAAGRGNIAKHLPTNTKCLEVKMNRLLDGMNNAPQCVWSGYDFLAAEQAPYDLIITNPPFSLGIAFIARGLSLLNRDNPEARLLYLLPCDFFHAVGRNRAFQGMDAHIYHTYQIVNRVAYIREGEQVKGRQVYDSIFDIRLGKKPGAVTFLHQR
jgi:hypothetical protein